MWRSAPNTLRCGCRCRARPCARSAAPAVQGRRDKDRGVARLARERLDRSTSARRTRTQRGPPDGSRRPRSPTRPILTAAVELDRRWKALVLGDDIERRAAGKTSATHAAALRSRAPGATRPHAVRAAAQPLAGRAQPPAETAELLVLRNELTALRGEAVDGNDASALARLERAEQQIAEWERVAPALAAAETLVVEAEQLATGTPIDDAQLPARWQALDLAARTPALSRRFEAALLIIEQRRSRLSARHSRNRGRHGSNCTRCCTRRAGAGVRPVA